MLLNLVEMQASVAACERTFKGGEVVSFLDKRVDRFHFLCYLVAPFAKSCTVTETSIADWRLAALAFNWRKREMLAVGTG